MKNILLLLTILAACKKTNQPEPEQPNVPASQSHVLQVIYNPGATNQELKINLDYPTGQDSIYYYTNQSQIVKTYTITADSIQVFGRSYDAVIERDSFTIKVDGSIIATFSGKSQTREFKIY